MFGALNQGQRSGAVHKVPTPRDVRLTVRGKQLRPAAIETLPKDQLMEREVLSLTIQTRDNMIAKQNREFRIFLRGV